MHRTHRSHVSNGRSSRVVALRGSPAQNPRRGRLQAVLCQWRSASYYCRNSGRHWGFANLGLKYFRKLLRVGEGISHGTVVNENIEWTAAARRCSGERQRQVRVPQQREGRDEESTTNKNNNKNKNKNKNNNKNKKKNKQKKEKMKNNNTTTTSNYNNTNTNTRCERARWRVEKRRQREGCQLTGPSSARIAACCIPSPRSKYLASPVPASNSACHAVRLRLPTHARASPVVGGRLEGRAPAEFQTRVLASWTRGLPVPG